MPVLLVWALAAEAALVVEVVAPTVAAAASMVVAVPEGLPLTPVTMTLVHPLGAVEVLPSGLEP
jgi:hypothetical protein